MPLENTTTEVTDSIMTALSSHDFSDAEKEKISKIIENVLVNTVEETTVTHNKVTVACCGPEADLAHQIREEVNRKKELLISNLMALR